ncbi:hypothetical protein D9756_002656 [Leucocoprinus leucothites]|uniref:Restriction of telomere capping protein 4 n=1 Tax=Leucocoprinus leucothites TaxID=201217 RepID=A0A8H5GBW6_9AGAR|nr:hypothetical protein D9756_002656 [Leucoagaricus leucothites]
MENIESRLRSSGESLYTARMARLKPLPSQGAAFEDLGSGFKQQTSKNSEKKPNKTRSTSLTPKYDADFDSASDDEMDCFSQKSQADEKVVVEKKGPKSRSDYDLTVIENKSRAIKGLKFKRNTTVEVGVEKPRKASASTSSPSKTKARLKGSRNGSERDIYSDEYETRRDAPKTKAKSDTAQLKPRPRPRPRSVAPFPTSLVENDIAVSSEPTTKRITRTPSEIPLPSPISKATTRSSKRNSPSSTNLSSNSLSNASTNSSSSHRPAPSLAYTSSLTSSKSASRIEESFPGPSPLNSPNVKRSKITATRSYPVISPRSNDGDVRQLPIPSPLSGTPKVAPRPRKKDKGKRKADVLAPFPMSTQDFGHISRSEDESDDGKPYARRRRLQIADEASAMVNNMDLYEEEDSLFMSPAVDPKTLCPYCDSRLPSSPTPFFLKLLESTLSKSCLDPRSTNPLGRKASLSTFVAVCQRHDFETEVLPEAEAKGWPKTINWEELADRVLKMKPALEEIIHDSGEADTHALVEDEGEGLMTSFISKGPRIQCVFWREAMKSLLKSGARAMADVRGQFLDFEKSQPGYYGELGQIIIQQTLFNMFPLDSFDLKLIKPFTANDFIQRVLVPEVALRLIMEDRGLKGLIGAETALPILRESTTYGVTMFPEDSGESGRRGGKSGKIGVGDRIVMERAMKRRKEIEEGGEVEALFEDAKGSGIAKERKKGKRRAIGPNTGDASKSQESEADEHEQGLLHKATKRTRKKGNTGTDDGTDAISITSQSDGYDSETNAQIITLQARSRPHRNTKFIDYNEGDSDHDEDIVPKRLRARRPGRSPSRLRSKPPSQARKRSPSASEWQRVRSPPSEWILDNPQGADLGSEVRSLELSDMDICSTDDNIGPKRDKVRSKAAKTPAKKFQRSQSKTMAHDSTKIVNLDLNTPLPKRHSVVLGESGEDEEPTPRPITRKPSARSAPQPKGHTVLARARARTHTAEETNVDPKAGKSKRSRANKSTSHDWKFNMRDDLMPQMKSSGSESESSVDVVAVETKSNYEDDRRSARKTRSGGEGKPNGEEDHSWLLDDPSP